MRKSSSLYGQKSNPNPKFLGTAKAYFVGHIGPKFQISLIYAFIGQWAVLLLGVRTLYPKLIANTIVAKYVLFRLQQICSQMKL